MWDTTRECGTNSSEPRAQICLSRSLRKTSFSPSYPHSNTSVESIDQRAEGVGVGPAGAEYAPVVLMAEECGSSSRQPPAQLRSLTSSCRGATQPSMGRLTPLPHNLVLSNNHQGGKPHALHDDCKVTLRVSGTLRLIFLSRPDAPTGDGPFTVRVLRTRRGGRKS